MIPWQDSLIYGNEGEHHLDETLNVNQGIKL